MSLSGIHCAPLSSVRRIDRRAHPGNMKHFFLFCHDSKALSYSRMLCYFFTYFHRTLIKGALKMYFRKINFKFSTSAGLASDARLKFKTSKKLLSFSMRKEPLNSWLMEPEVRCRIHKGSPMNPILS